jgi:hypothetical protein
MKCVIVPVVTVATTIVTEGLKKYLEAILGKHSIDSLRKTAVLGTAQAVELSYNIT